MPFANLLISMLVFLQLKASSLLEHLPRTKQVV